MTKWFGLRSIWGRNSSCESSCDKTIVDANILIDDKEFIKSVNGRPSYLHVLKRCGHNSGVLDSVRKPVLEGWSDLDDILNINKKG